VRRAWYTPVNITAATLIISPSALVATCRALP